MQYVGSSARISKKVEGGGIGIEIEYLFNAHPIFKGGIPYPSMRDRAVIVPGDDDR